MWLDEARQQLRAAVAFGRHSFGERNTILFVQQIEKNNIRLATFPNIGPVEPLLMNRVDHEYRYLIIHPNYKIIYYVDEEVIYIVALWDTRSNQEMLAVSL